MCGLTKECADQIKAAGQDLNRINQGHTPGPWNMSKYGNDYEEYGVYSETAPKSSDIASIKGKANAALIAAAPDLLEALLEIDTAADYCRGNDRDILTSSSWVKVKNAISKATEI